MNTNFLLFLLAREICADLLFIICKQSYPFNE